MIRWIWRWLGGDRRRQYWRVSWPTHEPRPQIRLQRGRSKLAQLRELRKLKP